LLDPRDPVAQAGMSAFSTGDAAGKESRLKQSLAQSPQSAALHFALGNLYTDQSRWGDAQQAYFNAFRLEPANALFAFSLATSLDHLGQGKLAAQYYGQALQIDSVGNSGFDRVQTQQRMNQLLAP
jgi:cytochrome c-type biogenesis protein CcmH/NrfG